MDEFRPKRIPKNKLDEMIQECMEGVVSADADLVEIKYWASIIPEALRYCYRKRKKIARTIDTISNRLDEIDAKFKLVYIHSSKAPSVSITEKKDFAISMKIARSKEYKELLTQSVIFNELLNGVDADIINLQEKSTSIRKFANIETSRMIYEDD